MKGVVIIEINDLNAWLAKNFVARRQPAETDSTGLAGRSVQGHISHTMGADCDWTAANQELFSEINEAARKLIQHCRHSAKLRLDLNWSITAPKILRTTSIDSAVSRADKPTTEHKVYNLPDTA